MLGSAATLLNDENLVKSIVENMKELKVIIQDQEKMKILTKIFEGCIKAQNKNKDNCKDLGKTLKTISNMNMMGPTGGTGTAGSSTLASGINLPFLQVDQQKIMDIVKNAEPEKVVEYFEQTEKLAKYKDSIQKSVPAVLQGAAGAFGDAMSSLHSWLTIQNAQKNSAKNSVQAIPSVSGGSSTTPSAGAGIAAVTVPQAPVSS